MLSPSGEGKWCGSTDRNLVSEKRQKNQLLLAFPEEDEGEALLDSGEGTDALAAMRESHDPVITSRTAAVRTRTPGGVGGGKPQGSPLSRFAGIKNRRHEEVFAV